MCTLASFVIFGLVTSVSQIMSCFRNSSNHMKGTCMYDRLKRTNSGFNQLKPVCSQCWSQSPAAVQDSPYLPQLWLNIASTHCTHPRRDGQAEWACIVCINSKGVSRSANQAECSLTSLMWPTHLPLRQSSQNCSTGVKWTKLQDPGCDWSIIFQASTFNDPFEVPERGHLVSWQWVMWLTKSGLARVYCV